MTDSTARVALVTGATSGIGLESARLLAQQGHRVYLCARDASAVAETVKALQSEDLDVDGSTADVRSDTDIQAVVRAAVTRFGTIDVLVNNAGRSGGGVTATSPTSCGTTSSPPTSPVSSG